SCRVEPDANYRHYQRCKGRPNTTMAWDEPIDTFLNKAREVSDQKERIELYRQAMDKFLPRRNVIYLYHANYIAAFPKNLKSYKAMPDGLIRIRGVSWQ